MRHRIYTATVNTIKHAFLTAILLFGLLSLYAQTTYTVKQDGTGDFTQIQPAINTAINNDTIVVHPGRYYDNIDFSGKSITLTSLYRYSNDRADIENTIIDGGGNTVISFTNEETRATCLDGFTVENGSRGIYILHSSPTVQNCIIQKNIGLGGMSVMGFPFLSGNVIRENVSYGQGGGLIIGTTLGMDYYGTVFDTVNKNSIYSNRASFTHDLLLYDLPFLIPLDTFTVSEDYLDHVYVQGYQMQYLPIGPTDIIQCENAVISFINHDLYVSPTGDDVNNSGLSLESPFKTISHAMYMIASDPINPKTIYVEPGTYSIDGNGEFFTIVMKSHVTVQGAGAEQTILSGEGISNDRAFFGSDRHTVDFKIKDIGFQNWGMRNVRYTATAIKPLSVHGFEVENCHFTNGIIGIGYVNGYNYYQINEGSTATFRNLVFTGLARHAISVYSQYGVYENITITGQRSQITETGMTMTGTPISFPVLDWMEWFYENGDVYHRYYTLANILIYDNEALRTVDTTGYPTVYACNAIYIPPFVDVMLTNATIVDNIPTNPTIPSTPIVIGNRSTLRVYNSILYGNSPSFSFIPGAVLPLPVDQLQHLYVNNSLIQGGEASLNAVELDFVSEGNIFGFIVLDWDESNLDANPLFDNNDLAFPYQLSVGSPAIGAGTLDLPDHFALPETDIMGNPRIVDGVVDMGAYQKSSNSDYNETVLPTKSTLLGNYPNPFNPSTTISFNVARSGFVSIEVYNVRGQKVRSLVSGVYSVGEHSVVWNGCADDGRSVGSGVYFYRMVSDGVSEVKKMLLLK